MALFETDIAELPLGFEYIAQCIRACRAKQLYSQLQHDIEWQQPSLIVFDKSHPIPRKQYYMGNTGRDYVYSGQLFKANPWHPSIALLRDKLNQHFNQQFNVALLNWYRDGNDRMGWHADDEPELGECPTIASISLGATRKFKIRNKQTKHVTELNLENGSCLMMSGLSQQFFQHCVPVQKRVKTGRINITFRTINT